ncbi:LysR family transcriptional regulator [Paralimibaculum aggregatum]|uniref:LysR family transcriptional regulator n=1 Tax=Paralimibaculum aggregatum TaxID=3036245 RepID=A0ABQ6LPM7_9RHOB|nr:LysR family transcriptional regulator [Limibaculum sp. NKW23]GMG84320.1 LysR family transcriptional regulator [Limibaculum sp. NKW23]
MPGPPRRLLPSTSALAAFEAVVRLGGFTAAARELSLTQGAVSRQVAGLEALLGTRLLERSSRGVAATELGRAYAAEIAAALETIRNASLAAMTDRHYQTLNLAIPPTFGTRWLMPRLPRFVERHPEVTLNFITRIGRVEFEQERIDAAIHVGRPDWPGAEFLELMRETVVPVASPGFLAEHRIGAAEDLLPLLRLHLASRPEAWAEWFASLGIAAGPGAGPRFEQFAMVAQACGAGLGVALLPEFLIRSELASGQLAVALDHRAESASAYWLATPAAPRLRPQVVAFRNWLAAEAAAPGGAA